jgi:hypothetical protein
MFQGGFTFWNFLVDVFVIFMFVVWFWLLISVWSDLIRRKDISGFGKVIWVIALLVLPFLGAFIYLISQGNSMAERNEARHQDAKAELRKAVGMNVADEIEKLDKLKASGSITAEEYARLRGRLVS